MQPFRTRVRSVAPLALACVAAAAVQETAGPPRADATWTARTRALLFLASAQREDGSWSSGVGAAAGHHDAGVGGLALLALLGEGNTPESGPFKLAVDRGARWLAEQQDPRTGRIGATRDEMSIYDHAVATLALAELQARAPRPWCADVVQRAVDFALDARNPRSGWRYDVPPLGESDTSVTGWMVLALEAAARAGIEVEAQAFAGAETWFTQATDPATGRVGYDSPGSRSSRIFGLNDRFRPERGEAMTALALACRLQLGRERSAVERQATLVAALPPAWDAGDLGCDMVYWYFGTRALSALGGERWETWRSALLDAVLPRQEADGSWSPVGPWGAIGGRAYSTALMAMSLAEAAAIGEEPQDASPRPVQVEESPYAARFSDEGKAAAVWPAEREAIGRGLAWLAAHQGPDGHWPTWPGGDARHDVGVTGLALLALLGDGNTLRDGTYQEEVTQGIRWLREQQDPESGLFGAAVGHAFLYDHAIATLAMCETYHLTRSPPLEHTAQKAVDYVLRARNPHGAWRYDVPPLGENDTSLTSWMVHALRAARYAGLGVDGEAFEGSLAWIDAVTDPSTGRIGYDAPGSYSARIQGINDHFPAEASEAMTAAGLWCRVALGQAPAEVPSMIRGAELLRATLPIWEPESFGCDMYYWFHGANLAAAVGASVREGTQNPMAPATKPWRSSFARAALEGQRSDGGQAGSWDPVGPWGGIGGRVYATAIMVMALQAPYRLP